MRSPRPPTPSCRPFIQLQMLWPSFIRINYHINLCSLPMQTLAPAIHRCRLIINGSNKIGCVHRSENESFGSNGTTACHTIALRVENVRFNTTSFCSLFTPFVSKKFRSFCVASCVCVCLSCASHLVFQFHYYGFSFRFF